MKKNITTQTKPNKILSYFKQATDKDIVNLKTSFGYIYLAGGILSKLDNHEHFIAIKGRWVKV